MYIINVIFQLENNAINVQKDFSGTIIISGITELLMCDDATFKRVMASGESFSRFVKQQDLIEKIRLGVKNFSIEKTTYKRVNKELILIVTDKNFSKILDAIAANDLVALGELIDEKGF